MATREHLGSTEALEQVGDIPHAANIPALAEFNFNFLVIKRKKMSEERDRLEKELREINDTLASAMSVAGVKRVRCGNFTVSRVDGKGASTLKKELLLEAGVPADTIIACTVEGKPYTTVMIREIKDAKFADV